MKQLASTSIKCVVSEENKEILKRSLCRELDLDFAQWKGNEIQFKGESFSRDYQIQINIDVLPDMKGYSFWAQSIDVHTSWWKWLFIALLGGGSTLFISVFLVFVVTHKEEPDTAFAIALLIVWGVLSSLFDSFYNWCNDYRIKSQIKKGFKQVFKMCDRK